ncbi:MAG: LysR substrate-binding domain-containing protein, partial [Pseudomonadota bacterium]
SPEGFFVHRLFDDQIFPACSPSLAAGPPALRELIDLNDVPLIHWDISQLDWAHSTRKWFTWERWLQHNGVNGLDTDRGLSFNDYGLAVQAAIAGQGLLLASWPILKEPIESGLLVCPFKERTITDIGYDLVTTSQAHARYEVKAFIDWMIETVRVD